MFYIYTRNFTRFRSVNSVKIVLIATNRFLFITKLSIFKALRFLLHSFIDHNGPSNVQTFLVCCYRKKLSLESTEKFKSFLCLLLCSYSWLTLGFIFQSCLERVQTLSTQFVHFYSCLYYAWSILCAVFII